MPSGYLGLTRDNERFYADLNRVIGKHLSVISKTGFGKSYLVGVLIEEFIKMRTPVVVIDSHGEYNTLRFPNPELKGIHTYGVAPKGFPDKVRIFAPMPTNGIMPYSLPIFDLQPSDIQYLNPDKLGASAMDILHRAVFELRGDKYTLDDIINTIQEMDTKAQKFTISSVLENISKLNLFSESPTKATDMVKKGKITIIELKGLYRNIKLNIASRIFNQLWEARMANRVPPFVLVVEEAHKYVPQFKTLPTSSILQTIASEGRKFGLGLCVVTQRPAKIHKDVLSQCGCQIYLKVTHPRDLTAIVDSIENVTKGLPRRIKRLETGECIISGLTDKTERIRVRMRHTRHGGEDTKIA